MTSVISPNPLPRPINPPPPPRPTRATARYYELSWSGYRQACADFSIMMARYFYPWRMLHRFHHEVVSLREPIAG